MPHQEWARQQYISKHQQWASHQWGNFYYYRMQNIRFVIEISFWDNLQLTIAVHTFKKGVTFDWLLLLIYSSHEFGIFILLAITFTFK